MITPDGMPLVWMLRLKGHKRQPRVYGPTLMLHILEMAAWEQIPVGFYGGRTSVLEMLTQRMQERFPGLQVAYAFSPPFRELTSDEDDGICQAIHASGTRILFVGLGCPKQERWIAAHSDRIPVVMLGVGAAFDFHAGVIQQAPTWVQKIGLEWLYRFSQEPGRLWKRYLIHNPRFIMLAIADLLGLYKV
jgi:N-acetylglucosaminyldiphosphoundecaprenol N-acetyl-beta-D-mannosaminyltransferase